MLYTRKGDNGTSGLYGTKNRFPKDSPIFDALGTLDELNSLLGLCKAHTMTDEMVDLASHIHRLQESIFIIQAELAGADKRVPKKSLDELECSIDVLEGYIEPPSSFVIPGAHTMSAHFDYARAVSRRAERATVHAREHRALSSVSSAYLNRISSMLYVLARYAARIEKSEEIAPSYDL